MKKLNSKLAFLLIVTGLLISCKNNNANTEGYNGTDSTETTIDSVGPPATDTANVNSGTGTGTGTGTNATGAGTTGATGEGSTGSGSAGTTQQGNSSVRTDSAATAPTR